MFFGRKLPLLHVGLVVCVCAWPAQAYVVTIASGTKAIFLQVGNGTMSGGTFSGGGTPGNNTTVNRVSVTVPANVLGTGAPQQMSSNSTQANSPLDNFAFCTTPVQVYVGGFYRTPGAAVNASLTVTAPASLTSGAGDIIPFSQISWTSSGAGDATPTFPSGSFNAGTQALYSFASNRWAESCFTFAYANASVVAAGVYTGRVTYTLSAP